MSASRRNRRPIGALEALPRGERLGIGAEDWGGSLTDDHRDSRHRRVGQPDGLDDRAELADVSECVVDILGVVVTVFEVPTEGAGEAVDAFEAIRRASIGIWGVRGRGSCAEDGGDGYVVGVGYGCHTRTSV